MPTSTCTLYVPAGSHELYAVAEQWSNFENIVEMEAPYRFGVADAEMALEHTSLLPVDMNNEDGVIGFQFDVLLPEGIELAKNSSNEYYLEGSSRFAGHQVSADDVDGVVRFVVVSLKNNEFSGNDGILFSLPLIVTGEPRTTAITLSNIKLSTVTHTQVNCPAVTSTITVIHAYIIGDSNDDGEISVVDVTYTIAAILGHAPESFVPEAADIDGNGEISINDVTSIIAMVLHQSLPLLAPNAATMHVVGESALSFSAIDCQGSTATAVLSLKDAARFIAGQIDIMLPEGVEVIGLEPMGTNAASHVVAWTTTPEGNLRAVAASLTNSAFADDLLLSLSLRSADGTSLEGKTLGFGGSRAVAFDDFGDMTETPVFGTDVVIGADNSVLDSLRTEGLSICVDGLKVTVTSPADTTILVADTAGRYSRLSVKAGTISFTLPASGLYFINNKKFIAK